jgi:hypothetical protein
MPMETEKGIGGKAELFFNLPVRFQKFYGIYMTFGIDMVFLSYNFRLFDWDPRIF